MCWATNCLALQSTEEATICDLRVDAAVREEIHWVQVVTGGNGMPWRVRGHALIRVLVAPHQVAHVEKALDCRGDAGENARARVAVVGIEGTVEILCRGVARQVANLAKIGSVV